MIRIATPDDIDAIAAIQAGAFGFREDAGRCASVRAEVARDPASWMVLPVAGQVCGALYVHRQRLHIGDAMIVKGDVGGVAVPPEQHGGGLGTRLMQETVAWMRGQDIAISRLGGLVRFYARFGYQRFPRRYMEFAVGQTVPAGNSRVREGAVPLEDAWADAIRPYDPAAHGPAVRDLLGAFNARYAGSPVVEDADIPPAGSCARVFLEGGEPIAYLRGHEFDHDHTEFEARITIGEVAADPAKPHGLAALIAHAANDALARGIPRITARIPFDPRLIAALSALPLRFQLIETFGGASSNMLMVVNLRVLLSQLLPELNARLAHSPSGWRGTLGITVEDQQATLAFGDDIRLADAPAEVALDLSQHAMLSLALGLLTFDEVDLTVALPAGARAVLRALFPRRLVYSGCWG